MSRWSVFRHRKADLRLEGRGQQLQAEEQGEEGQAAPLHGGTTLSGSVLSMSSDTLVIPFQYSISGLSFRTAFSLVGMAPVLSEASSVTAKKIVLTDQTKTPVVS